MRRGVIAVLVAVVVRGVGSPALAIDEAHKKKAEQMIEKSIVYLRTQQDAKSGGWGVPPGGQGPVFPAVTGLVVSGMLMQPGIDERDPSVKAGVGFLLRHRQPDGGIYDSILPSYNTAIALSALAKVNTPEAQAAVRPAQDFLRSLQYGEGAGRAGAAAKEAQVVPKAHPFYGGVGYGRHGRPDLSNTGFFIQAMHDSGVPADDPAMQRALVFLQRVQMEGSVNDMPYAKGSRQGGFIYATSENKDQQGTGQSFAGAFEETLDDGTKVSRLRAYGSMTYAGFKSLIYAGLKKDDPRVKAAMGWIAANYTLEENPAVGTDGLYYYLLVFARAMDAWGEPAVAVTAGGKAGERDWANDLIDRLAALQNEDGSFRSVDDRWMEDNPVLITAYSLLALQHAAR